MDRKRRSFTKAVSYRTLATAVTFGTALLTTRSPEYSGSISALDMGAKIALFYTHERVWNFIPWGRKKAGNEITETHARSVVKGFTYRVLGSTTTAAISFAVTGNIKIAAEMGLLDIVSKTSLYYLHERMWKPEYLQKRQPNNPLLEAVN